MPQELLDVPDVGAALEQMGGAGVAEEMRPALPADAGALDVAGDLAPQGVGVEGLAVAGEEERGPGRADDEQGADVVEVLLQPGQGARSDGHDAVLAPLAQADVQQPALALQVGEFQAHQLGAADAGGVKQFEQGAVAQAQGIGDVGLRQHGLDLGGAQRGDGQALLGAGHFEVGGGVGVEVVPPAEPRKEVHDPAQALALGADAEGAAVGPAEVPEPALIALQDGAGDLRGAEQVALVRPGEEGLEFKAPRLDGVGGVVEHAQARKVVVGQRRERGRGRAAAGEAVGRPLLAAALIPRALAHPAHGVEAGFHGE